MAFFFTMIAKQRRQVTVRDQNMRHINFDDFQILGRDTYLVPLERLNCIRLEKTGYVATSILKRDAKPVIQCFAALPVQVDTPKPVVNQIVIDKPCFDLKIPTVKRKQRQVPAMVEVSRARIKELRGLLTPVYHSVNSSYGEQLYQQDKTAWINQYGSEDLKYAHSVGFDCNCGYILQRAALDFPGFEVQCEHRAYQIDTPDIEIVKFITEEALTLEQLASIRRYKSKISVHEKEEDENDLIVVIQNYLFHCDLVISLSKLVHSTHTEDEEEAS